jgi:predicted transcriptional regulator
MYYLPQEIEVWYIIPAIRRELSYLLVKKYGWTLESAGGAMGVSKSAVSQYISKKRGQSIKLPSEIMSEVDLAAKSISEKKTNAFSEIMRLLRICKVKGVACLACKKFNKEVFQHCEGKPHSYDKDLS